VRNGRFERAWRPDGTPYYRLRWDGEPETLTGVDVRRLEFLRYLIQAGRFADDGPDA
jgi:hypothetical protein